MTSAGVALGIDRHSVDGDSKLPECQRAQGLLGRVPIRPAVQLYDATTACPMTDRGCAAAGYIAKGHGNSPTLGPYCNGLSARTLELRALQTGFAEEMIFMAIRLLNVMCLAAVLVFPAHSQNLRALFEPGVVAITTYLEPITEDDVDQRTKLDLLLTQKQVSREDAINDVSVDLFRIARAEIAGLLSDDLVDKAFADMCSRRGVAPSDLMKTLEEKGIRLDTLRKRLRSEVARERLARMQCRRNCEDRLDHPLFPKM
jgi:hypothetical protein